MPKHTHGGDFKKPRFHSICELIATYGNGVNPRRNTDFLRPTPECTSQHPPLQPFHLVGHSLKELLRRYSFRSTSLTIYNILQNLRFVYCYFSSKRKSFFIVDEFGVVFKIDCA